LPYIRSLKKGQPLFKGHLTRSLLTGRSLLPSRWVSLPAAQIHLSIFFFLFIYFIRILFTCGTDSPSPLGQRQLAGKRKIRVHCLAEYVSVCVCVCMGFTVSQSVFLCGVHGVAEYEEYVSAATPVNFRRFIQKMLGSLLPSAFGLFTCGTGLFTCGTGTPSPLGQRQLIFGHSQLILGLFCLYVRSLYRPPPP
jgi:hypothetical protein